MLQPARGHQLHADANSEERLGAADDFVLQRVPHAGYGLKAVAAVLEGAHTRKHDTIRLANLVGIGSDFHLYRQSIVAGGAFEGLGRGMQIARAVIDDGNAHG